MQLWFWCTWFASGLEKRRCNCRAGQVQTLLASEASPNSFSSTFSVSQIAMLWGIIFCVPVPSNGEMEKDLCHESGAGGRVECRWNEKWLEMRGFVNEAFQHLITDRWRERRKKEMWGKENWELLPTDSYPEARAGDNHPERFLRTGDFLRSHNNIPGT